MTGASRGIGKAAAIKLAEAGFDVAVTARTLKDGEGRVDTDPSIAVPGGLDTTVEAIEHHGVRGDAQEIAAKVERVMCAAGEEYLKTVPVKVETEIADEWVK